jgi:hypothetical protein
MTTSAKIDVIWPDGNDSNAGPEARDRSVIGDLVSEIEVLQCLCSWGVFMTLIIRVFASAKPNLPPVGKLAARTSAHAKGHVGAPAG